MLHVKVGTKNIPFVKDASYPRAILSITDHLKTSLAEMPFWQSSSIARNNEAIVAVVGWHPPLWFGEVQSS